MNIEDTMMILLQCLSEEFLTLKHLHLVVFCQSVLVVEQLQTTKKERHRKLLLHRRFLEGNSRFSTTQVAAWTQILNFT